MDALSHFEIHLEVISILFRVLLPYCDNGLFTFLKFKIKIVGKFFPLVSLKVGLGIQLNFFDISGTYYFQLCNTNSTGWCISFGPHIFSCRDYNLNFPAIFGLAADARLPKG